MPTRLSKNNSERQCSALSSLLKQAGCLSVACSGDTLPRHVVPGAGARIGQSAIAFHGIRWSMPGKRGVIVWLHRCRLRRKGLIETATSKLAFISWHALARMHERSEVDVFVGGGLVAGCGIAGRLMRGSSKHANTPLNLTIGEITAAGVLRTNVEQRFAFFDVLTVLTIDETQASKRAALDQGRAVLAAAFEYVQSGDLDPRPYADKVPVLPCRDDDFVSRTLKQAAASPG